MLLECLNVIKKIKLTNVFNDDLKKNNGISTYPAYFKVDKIKKI